MLPSQLDDYVLTLRRLREKYADKLHIHIGLEAEYFPAYLGWLREETERLDIEYLILGCHYDTTDEQDARGQPLRRQHLHRPRQTVCRTGGGSAGNGALPVSGPPRPLFEPGDGLRRRRRESLPGHLCRSGAAGHPLEYNMAGLTFAGPSRRLFGLHRDEFWRIAAEYPVKAIMGCDAHAPSELDVVPAIEEKKAFLHSLGIPVLDTLPGLE